MTTDYTQTLTVLPAHSHTAEKPLVFPVVGRNVMEDVVRSTFDPMPGSAVETVTAASDVRTREVTMLVTQKSATQIRVVWTPNV